MRLLGLGAVLLAGCHLIFPFTPAGQQDADLSSVSSETGSDGSPDAVDVCRDKYGSAPGFVLCWTTADGCAFNAETNGTCDQMCARHGGVCLAAYDNPNEPGEECIDLRPEPCGGGRLDTNICVCSR